MVVYRLERKGWGVFCNDINPTMPYSLDTIYTLGYCSLPEQKRDPDWRFGCESIEDLIEYFGGDFAWAIDRGAEVVQYQVHKAHVRFGLEIPELAFKIEKAEKVN